MAVVEDYYYEADKGHDQDNLTGDEQASEDLPEIGTWGQKEDAADVIGPIEPTSEAGHRYILTLVDYATRYQE